MSRCARDILTLSLGVLASPDSSANIFIFSLKDNCSGIGAVDARACCSASRRARGSLYTSCAPMTPGVCVSGAECAVGDVGLASMLSASSMKRSGSSLVVIGGSCNGGGEQLGGAGGAGATARSWNDTRLSRSVFTGDCGAGAGAGAGA